MSMTARPLAACALALVVLAAGCGDDEGGAPPPPAAPLIITQPAEVAAAEGAWVTFTVEATGQGLEYEWQHSYDGGTTWFPLAWGAWESYTLDGVSFGVDGVAFRCVVSNAGGEAVSDVAELHVLRVIFVDASATGACNGMTWENAFTDLQDALGALDALAAAAPGWEVWVAAGTYTPTDTTDRTATFRLVPDTEIYGGFLGQEMALDERDYAANVTILSGNIGDTGLVGDNSYHVVAGADGARLDGFTITDGFATDNFAVDGGAGMHNYEASPIVVNCTFSANSAPENAGGGMHNYDASPTILNCTFIGNSAANGAGIWNDGSSSPSITDCTFDGNAASIGGGGLYNYAASSPTVTGCTFDGNSAQVAGGMNNVNGSSPIVMDCTFSGNSSLYDGGGMHNYESSPTITNCLFIRNAATWGGGGGLYNRQSSFPAITNCAFHENSAGIATHGGGGMMNYDWSDAVVTNCTFSSNHAYYGGGMFNSVGSAPTVTNCILWGNAAITSGAEIYNGTGVPVVSYSCVEGGLSGPGCGGAASDGSGGGNIGDLSAHDPLFVNAADFVDMTTAVGADTTSITVAAAGIYAVGDEIEVGLDGVPREVTAAAGTTVTFDTAGDELAVPCPGDTLVRNWGPGATDLTVDLHLGAASSCIDTADPATTLTEDIEGDPRPAGSGYDMGAYEYQ